MTFAEQIANAEAHWSKGNLFQATLWARVAVVSCTLEDRTSKVWTDFALRFAPILFAEDCHPDVSRAATTQAPLDQLEQP